VERLTEMVVSVYGDRYIDGKFLTNFHKTFKSAEDAIAYLSGYINNTSEYRNLSIDWA
jgi:viroplasmin and RNaseH domain-containing protein